MDIRTPHHQSPGRKRWSVRATSERLGVVCFVLLCGLCIQPASAAEEAAVTAASGNPMPLGVDDAGSDIPLFKEPREQQVFDEIGFDFLSYHLGRMPLASEIAQLDAWARKTGHDYILNNEGGQRERGSADLYRKPGLFFQLPKDLVEVCRSSPRFLGICYDELDHCITNGAWIAILDNKYAPCFYDASGDTLEQAYEGNVHNVGVLMDTQYPGFAANARERGKRPVVCGEYVFPVLNHLLARGGIVPAPKLLKESITPVTAAVALGAAKQYGLPYWPCLDLWGSAYPGHSPEELWSSLLFSYWTGAERAYVENLGCDGTNALYKGSLYVKAAKGVVLSPWGEVVKAFKRDYMPQHPRSVSSRDFNPEIVIVHFEDSDWGQEKTGNWISGYLYGVPDLKPDPETRYWFKIWNVISHGATPLGALNYNTLSLGQPYRFFFPANNVAVYDHLASDPDLYRTARLVFLSGKIVSAECMATLGRLVDQNGLTVVTPPRLAPADMQARAAAPYAFVEQGKGRWIVTDDVTQESVVTLLKPYLGRPDEMRFRFGTTDIVFTAPHPAEPIKVDVKASGTTDRRR